MLHGMGISTFFEFSNVGKQSIDSAHLCRESRWKNSFYLYEVGLRASCFRRGPICSNVFGKVEITTGFPFERPSV